MSKGKYYFSKSLEKGLKILALFNRETAALTQSEIARKLGLNMTSTYRYINTLVELGYLEKDARSKLIRPAILCLPFCNNLMSATDHKHLFKGVIDRIHGEHNISIEAALVISNTIVRIYHRSAKETLTYHLPDSSSNCLHNTALGKAYLFSQEPEVLDEKIKTLELTPKTEHTITSETALRAELDQARLEGYTKNVEEYLPGLIAIAAPLVDPRTGTGIGAVSFDFSLLQINVEEMEMNYAALVCEVAKVLSDIVPPDRTGE
ncbi:MAG: IclR family transcriptional regulator [Desulfobulbaceae bacterium]|nr:MAG: IclR family transcriptional regulator [Desulfobulbaceae bacterium]